MPLAAGIAIPHASAPQVTRALCGLGARRNVAAAVSQQQRRFKTRATSSRYSALTAERAANFLTV